jgi:RHS repeat-associated protein
MNIRTLLMTHAFIITFNIGWAQVPESPTTEVFISNTIQNEMDVHPGDGIQLIEVPTASQRGNVELSFPIKLPPGRNEMEPQVEIRYDSEFGNGWCGVGWDLYIPSIKVDTRWGVPRYSADMETETYIFEGVQLGPVSHRNALQQRSSDKQFYPRVEGSFSKIIRHGDGPHNYWWEVTDKDGTKRFYGGLPDEGAIPSATLTDDQGNIAHWSLVEIRNLNENFVRYHHVVVKDTGIPGGTVLGAQMYPQRITYTGFGKDEGQFEILFIRDRDLGESKRKDIGINASLGLKEVNADLLRKVEIRLMDQLVRSYELTYEEGAFFKTLLSKIIEYDSEGIEFYAHTFEYYDDVRSGDDYQPFQAEDNWVVPNDNIKGGLLTANPLFPDKTTVLGGGFSSEFSVGGAITVGPLGNPAALTNTAGPNFNYGESQGKGLAAFVDLNGDGLPDKVFNQEGRMYYRPNEWKVKGTATFGEKVEVIGPISDFSLSKTSNVSIGAEAHPGPVFLGYNYTTSKTTVRTYFSDFNGDGLVDIAHNGKVYFNHLAPNGVPTFNTDSGLTPNPIVVGDPPDPSLFEVDSTELEKSIDDFPLHDVVRMWQAPYPGIIQIEAPVRLIEDETVAGQSYEKADGVRVAIQRNGVELWNETISAGDYSDHFPSGVKSILLQKGDRIYFRVHSIFDGAYDRVDWNPEITYLGENDFELDAQGKPTYVFNSKDDFITASCQILSMPNSGKIGIKGVFAKPVTSDDLKVQVVKIKGTQSSLVLSMPMEWDTVFNGSIELDSIEVDSADQILFRIQSNTNVDWSAIHWDPQLYYSSLENGDPVNDADGNPLFSFCPAPEFEMYNEPLIKTPEITGIDSGQYMITPRLSLPDNINGKLTFSVKAPKRFYAKTEIQVNNGSIQNPIPLQVPIALNDTLYFEYHSADSLLAASVTSAVAFLQNGNDTTSVLAGLWKKVPGAELIFGNLYRGWGQFTYNGNRERANQPIQEAELRLPELDVDTSMIDENINPDSIDIDYDFTKEPFILMISDQKSKSWIGSDNRTYIQEELISSSRLGRDDLLPETFTSGGGVVGAPFITSEVEMNSTALGAGVGIVSGSAGTSWAKTKNTFDVIDMNGDGYPDMVTPLILQYTNTFGGLESASYNHSFKSHEAGSFAYGFSVGGAYVESSAATTGDASQPYVSTHTRGKTRMKTSRRSGRVQKNQKSKTSGTKSKANRSSKKAGDGEDASEASVGISANIGFDRDSIQHTWLDINGDGLADWVTRDGMVSLNLGYRFAPAEKWNFQSVRAGGNRDLGAGAGVNLFNGSIAFGTSLANSEMISDIGMLDVNSDGLADQIVSIEPLTVRLNLGNGFSEPIQWQGADFFEKGVATGESVNTAFTFCIPILLVRICFNPSGVVGRGVSRQLNELIDVDGDGFLDYVSSEDDGDLKTKRSAIGRTNLLRKVYRPMGASFTLDYENVGNTYDLPNSVWVMNELEVNDGVPGDGADLMKMYIEYENGKYDRREREFFGFEKVIIHELDTEHEDSIVRTTETLYENSNYYLKGLQKSEGLLDSEGRKYSETTYQYQLKDSGTGNLLPPTFASSDFGMAFPALVESKTYIYEGNQTSGLQTSTKYTYDQWGNTIKILNTGDGTEKDILFTTITYFDDETTYLKSVPSSIIDSSQTGILRKKEMEIDPSGDFTLIRRFLEDGQVAITEIEYDVYGNQTKITLPENIEGKRMQYVYRYEDILNQYLIEKTDSYGYRSAMEYDFAYGELLSKTDINDQKTEIELDSRGRVKQILGPYEADQGLTYTVKFDYYPNAEAGHVITSLYDPEFEKDIQRLRFVDGLGRTIQEKHPGNISDGNGAGQIKMVVSGRDFYDGLGRIKAINYPTSEPIGNNARLNQMIEPTTPIQQLYDVLDRPRATTMPDGSVTTHAYGIQTDITGEARRNATTIDPLGNIKTTFSDVRGRTRAEMMLGPDGEIWTTFDYNALSELESSYDHGGNATEFEYDNFGRRTRYKHPDQGATEYVYDLSGNLIKEISQNIKDVITNEGAILYTYDFNRLIQIDFPKNVQNRVQLHYGQPGAPFNRAGRVWLREDASGGEELFFGPLGETVKSIRTIIINQANVETFVSEYEYDTWNRIQTISYPDGEKVQYKYHASGQLGHLESEKQNVEYTIIDEIGYDPFGQQVYLKFGNGVVQKHQFEVERRRLKNTELNLPDGETFQSCNYQYDPIDNILQVNNGAAPVEGQIGGPSNFEFSYDELYRLKSAAGEWNGRDKNSTFSSSFEYDDLQNLKRKQQEHFVNDVKVPGNTYDYHYQYEGMQPHTPSEVGGLALSYDGNGNLSATRSSKAFSFSSLLWDEENRLMGISNNGYITQYTYDGLGERIVKSHGGIQGVFINGAPAGAMDHRSNYAVYVSPYLTREKDRFTKHYFIEGQHIASRVGTGKFENKYWPNRSITAGNLNFVKRMQLVEKTQAEYFKTLGIPPGPPTLPGYYAQPENTGNPLPGASNHPYSNPPLNWPRPIVHADPSGPPGPPVQFGDSTEIDVKAGYGFFGLDVFAEETEQYYYHKDQTGSTSYVTDALGNVRQYVAYFPFGDIFVKEEKSDHEQDYLFNGKLFDEEAGVYYYGARYYDPKLSLWASVDPMAENFPASSPYAYTLHNPVNHIDPDGKKPQRFSSADAAAIAFAKKYNPKSIAENREYGARIRAHQSRNGKLYYTYGKVVKGGESGLNLPQRHQNDVADIHTHAGWSPDYDSWMFSFTDLSGNLGEDAIGYVATPEGKLLSFNPFKAKVKVVSSLIPFDGLVYGPEDISRSDTKGAFRKAQIQLGKGESLNDRYGSNPKIPRKRNKNYWGANDPKTKRWADKFD